MKISEAIQYLNEYQDKEAEICVQWYTKEDMCYDDDKPISDEVWNKALRIMDKSDLSDLRYMLDEAIYWAKEGE